MLNSGVGCLSCRPVLLCSCCVVWYMCSSAVCLCHQEMKLLAEVDRPGSLIDNYVTQLSFVLSRKAASLVSLQARLARFQHRLKEQEILSRKRVPR